jgi:hypothetical protein
MIKAVVFRAESCRRRKRPLEQTRRKAVFFLTTEKASAAVAQTVPYPTQTFSHWSNAA